MTIWHYNEQDEGEKTITEEEILATYYEWWQGQMVKANHADLINKERCIEDWALAHWAWRESESA